MKLIYKGKFDGDINSLPTCEHEKGAVKFKEFDDMRKLSVFANVLALIITIVCFALLLLRDGTESLSLIGCLFPILILYPHELLHAVCFKETVYMYTNLKQGMMFVAGTENMSKVRFVLMSLCPNIIFGFIQFLLYMIFPNLNILGTMGALAIGMGAGDYYNIFNCLTQVPKGGKVYVYGMNTYWFKEN